GDVLFGASTFTDYLVESATAGSGYTLRQAQPNDQCCNALFTEDGLAGAPGSYAATFTYSTSLSYRAALVAFRPASSLTAPGTPITGPSATTPSPPPNTAGPTNMSTPSRTPTPTSLATSTPTLTLSPISTPMANPPPTSISTISVTSTPTVVPSFTSTPTST